MQIQISPDALFSTGETSRMLNVEGLTRSRIQMLCQKGLIPNVKTSDKGNARFKIAFKDFDTVLAAHDSVRTLNRNKGKDGPTYVEFTDLYDAVNDMGAQITKLTHGLSEAEHRVAELERQLGINE